MLRRQIGPFTNCLPGLSRDPIKFFLEIAGNSWVPERSSLGPDDMIRQCAIYILILIGHEGESRLEIQLRIEASSRAAE